MATVRRARHYTPRLPGKDRHIRMQGHLDTVPQLSNDVPRAHSVEQLDGSDLAAVRRHALHPVEPVLLRGYDPGGGSLQWTLCSLRARVSRSRSMSPAEPDRTLQTFGSWSA